MSDIIRSPGSVKVPRKNKKRKGKWVWTPPASGQIKVNVNDSYFGSSGKGGIGGVFRDLDGKVLLQFGKEVLVDSTVHVEVLAFRGEILVAVTSRWVSTYSFLFESDSKSVVAWVVNLSSA